MTAVSHTPLPPSARESLSLGENSRAAVNPGWDKFRYDVVSTFQQMLSNMGTVQRIFFQTKFFTHKNVGAGSNGDAPKCESTMVSSFKEFEEARVISDFDETDLGLEIFRIISFLQRHHNFCHLVFTITLTSPNDSLKREIKLNRVECLSHIQFPKPVDVIEPENKDNKPYNPGTNHRLQRFFDSVKDCSEVLSPSVAASERQEEVEDLSSTKSRTSSGALAMKLESTPPRAPERGLSPIPEYGKSKSASPKQSNLKKSLPIISVELSVDPSKVKSVKEASVSIVETTKVNMSIGDKGLIQIVSTDQTAIDNAKSMIDDIVSI